MQVPLTKPPLKLNVLNSFILTIFHQFLIYAWVSEFGFFFFLKHPLISNLLIYETLYTFNSAKFFFLNRSPQKSRVMKNEPTFINERFTFA